MKEMKSKSHAPEVGLHELGMGRVWVEQLFDETLVCGFREPAFLVQEGHNAHGLLDQLDRRLQIQSKVDKLPFDTFSLVFLLLEDEHGVVEELLQFLVGVVDAELLKRVEFEDLETGHIQDTDEGSTLPLGSVQRSVDAAHQPAEHALETRFRYRLDSKFNLKEPSTIYR